MHSRLVSRPSVYTAHLYSNEALLCQTLGQGDHSGTCMHGREVYLNMRTLRVIPGTCMHVCIQACLYTCMCVCMHACLCVHGERGLLKHALCEFIK